MWGVLAILVVGQLGFVGAVAADSDSVTPFYFSGFAADYYLSRDDDGTSKLKVKELLVAEFEESNNYNHGIERALPKFYKFDGKAKTETHSFDLKIDRVAGGTWTTYNNGDFTVIRIGDTDKMVHGTMEYEIDWSATNVTRNFDNGDEFYWKANGTGWKQNFELVAAIVHIPADLVSELDGRVKCAIGEDDRECEIEIIDDGDEKVLIFKSPTDQIGLVGGKAQMVGVSAGETLTFDIGFKPGTFKKPAFDVGAMFGVPTWVFWLITVSAVFLTIGAVVRLMIVMTKYRPAKTGHAIVPEYLPPKDMSVAESALWFSANAANGQQTLFPATLINLAVHHYIEIIEEKKTLGGKKFSIKLLKLPDDHLSEDDRDILSLVFAGKLTVGEIIKTSDIQSVSVTIMKTIDKIQKRLDKERGFYRANLNLNVVLMFVTIALFAGMVFGAIFLESVLPLAYAPGVIVLLVAVVLYRPISLAGMEAREYLMGLKMYMKLAEAERLKVLQSVKGAERVNHDGKEIIKLYEKLLPFAVIFGITKDWAKALQVYYDQNPSLVPVWYVGGAGIGSISSFNATDFAHSISSFSSSGSGFSSGGSGFSGGGGGGGGGGGW